MTTTKRRTPGLNPWGDDAQTHPPLRRDEKEVLKRLRAGESLMVNRHFLEREYVIGFYWEKHPDYAEQADSPVVTLLARQLVRVVTCAGGATWIRVVEATGKEAL